MGFTKMEKKFDVTSTGQHQICLTNSGKSKAQIELDMKVNKEWGGDNVPQAITKKHFRPVEMQAAKVNQMIDLLRKELSELVASEVELSNQNESIKSRVIVFGIVSVCIMGVSTFMQVKYLKNFFRHKKII